MYDTFDLNHIQKLIRGAKLSGWLFYDFQGIDPISVELLKVKSSSRRWYYLVPAQGAPVKIVHAVDSTILDHLPGKKRVYLSLNDLKRELKSVAGQKRLAVQFSEQNNLPDISRIDAGTLELLQNLGVKPVSSADLVQIVTSKWSEGQLNTHRNAARELNAAIQKSLRWIKRKISSHQEVTEWTAATYLQKELTDRGLVSDVPPAVATGRNSGVPYYIPTDSNHSPLLPGQIVQISLAGKEKSEHAVYATQAWIGYLGNQFPEQLNSVFQVLAEARDKAIEFTNQSLIKKKKITGYDVDRQVQQFIAKAGYDSYVLHRTGHSIGRNIVEAGVSIDSLEIQDTRRIIPQTCFTVEPALYFSEYGMRVSANVYVEDAFKGVSTAPVQSEITKIL